MNEPLLITPKLPGVLWRKGRLGAQVPASRFVEVIMTGVATLKQ